MNLTIGEMMEKEIKEFMDSSPFVPVGIFVVAIAVKHLFGKKNETET